MRFCEKCDNMYYISIPDGGNQLVYYCRQCGHTDSNVDSTESIIVSKKSFKQQDHSFEHMINQYTHLDPTLPHTSTVRCPSAQCPTNKDAPGDEKKPDNDVIYMRYDFDQMKYVYLCTHCKHVWTNVSKITL